MPQLDPEVAALLVQLGKQRAALDQRINDIAWAAATQAGIDPAAIEAVEDDGTVKVREAA